MSVRPPGPGLREKEAESDLAPGRILSLLKNKNPNRHRLSNLLVHNNLNPNSKNLLNLSLTQTKLRRQY